MLIGRGGQGAKSAAMILAKAAAKQELYIQAFPEYGPERMGAPVKAYVKIDKDKISSFTPITEPDYVLLIDDTLVDIAKELLMKNTVLIINSCKTHSYFKEKFNIANKMVIVDASNISIKNIGLNKPNIPILGALLKIYNEVDIKNVKKAVEDYFTESIGKEKALANVNAVSDGFDEAKL
ncbi:Pyruvate/ketoisovalerate oxidoreductases common subunit gamma [Candidatus Tiddalikarchaeum anstoanum]|nr:Pyruvate/ketoisovalerate oxidoreductases common subunit gamma [Candidatus Tiddalikarchaeum anstoanum]